MQRSLIDLDIENKYRENYRRYLKAIDFFNSEDIDQKEKEKHIGSFRELLYIQNGLHLELRRAGIRPSSLVNDLN